MNKIIFIFFFSLFWSQIAWATCNVTINTAETTDRRCDSNDILTITSDGSLISAATNNSLLFNTDDNVTINNAGTIEVGSTETGETDKDIAINATSSTNSTITNSGTIRASGDSAISIQSSTGLTINNESTGTIATTNRKFAIKGPATNLTINNYGTISSGSDKAIFAGGDNWSISNYSGGTISAGGAGAIYFDSDASDAIIYNEGTITSSGNNTVRLNELIRPTLTNHGTISSTTGSEAVNIRETTGSTITNTGSIKSLDNNSAIGALKAIDVTIDNSGTIHAKGDNAIKLDGSGGVGVTGASITNSGTISAGGDEAIYIGNNSSGIAITNTETISAIGTSAIYGDNNVFGFTLTNSGTITADDKTVYLETTSTINNSGTISATNTGADKTAIRIDGDNNTITNTGTISGTDSIRVVSGATGNKIIVDGNNVTFTGEIELNSTATTFELNCTLTKDIDIEIFDKTSMDITNNLCGNDTFEILDSNKVADPDNSESNGYLRIYGEDLDIAQNNAQYRSENVLSKLRGILSPANDDRDLHAFRSARRRSEYTDNTSGAVGYFNSSSISPASSDYFISYADQRVSFANSEYRGGENIALGMNKKFSTNQFNYYITPLIGFEDLDIRDVETEGNQAVNTTLTSQFMGFDAGIGRAITANEKNSSSFKMHATYGAQRFPGYTASFTDGELLVDDSVDQVLGANFEIRNSLGIERNVQLYVGGNWSETLSDELEITADGENKNVSPEMQKALGHYVGIDVRVAIKGFSLDLNLEYGTTGGLTHQVASLSLVRSF